MKIVYCLNRLNVIGGIERVTVIKANAFSQLPGNEVYIILSDNHGDDVPFELSPAVHLIDMKIDYSASWNPQKSTIVNYLNYRKRKKEHKIQLENLLESISPDVVISTGTGEKRMLTSMKNRRWKLIIEQHGERDFFVKESRSSFQKLLVKAFRFYDEQFTLKKCDKIVVLTSGDMQDNWQGWKNMAAIPNPVPFKCEQPSALTAKRVISVGRLDHMKNVSSMINVFKKVSEKHSDWLFEIYGDGPEMKSLQEQVSRLGLERVVFLRGFATDVKSELEKSSIFAFTSLSEGFGMAIIEAMECGLPVVTYDCPYGPREIVSDGSDGYLIPVNDENMMADRICRLIEDEELRKKMGQAAKIKAQSYQIESIIDRWMNLFNELSGRK